MNGVCGIVITTNPKPDVVFNLERLHPQVEHMVVVDNGSRPENLAPIREAASRLGFTLLETGLNRGIAPALNHGVEYARRAGARFVALFDEDSTAERDLIEALLGTYEANAPTKRIAIVSAKHVHKDTREWMKPVFDKDGGPFVAITSGSLLPVSVLDACGLMEEDFIIDRVDEEFCLRVRSRGYTVVHCERGILWVTLGEPKPYTLWGRVLFRAKNYNPGRRYYISRNRLVIVKRYWWRYPRWCYWALSGFVKEGIIILLAEKQRGIKVLNMMRAVRDAIFGRMGLIVPLGR